METKELRRLAIVDLTDEALAALIEHGESDLVERKQALPNAPNFGAAVASFANTLGGWVLLGVDDDGNVVGFPMDDRLDVQSHLAAVLKNEVDPLPSFVALRRTVGDEEIAVLRVFESSNPPHVVKGTGAVYIRTAKGKELVEDQAALIEIAKRGRDALADAQERLWALPLISRHIGTPEAEAFEPNPEELLLIVRAAPLTVTPVFNDWGISERAKKAASAAAATVVQGEPSAPFGPSERVEPQGRGLLVLCVERLDMPLNDALWISHQALPRVDCQARILALRDGLPTIGGERRPGLPLSRESGSLGRWRRTLTE